MVNPSLAVKAFILNDKDEILLIKRVSNDIHAPSVWEIPGGRLDPGENPFEGLKRETKEETGLEIDIKHPIQVDHFTRDDGQIITMVIFLCNPLTNSVKLSKEHTDFEWSDLGTAKSKVHPAFKRIIEHYESNFR
ncbi:MAG: NUDIX domain-containing protein [Candidatus Woesearchaeota archaeon]